MLKYYLFCQNFFNNIILLILNKIILLILIKKTFITDHNLNLFQNFLLKLES